MKMNDRIIVYGTAIFQIREALEVNEQQSNQKQAR